MVRRWRVCRETLGKLNQRIEDACCFLSSDTRTCGSEALDCCEFRV